MMMIVQLSCKLEEQGGERGVWKNLRGEEGNTENGGMVQPSQQYVARCIKSGSRIFRRRTVHRKKNNLT